VVSCEAKSNGKEIIITVVLDYQRVVRNEQKLLLLSN
jgi:hypothetical protein